MWLHTLNLWGLFMLQLSRHKVLQTFVNKFVLLLNCEKSINLFGNLKIK